MNALLRRADQPAIRDTLALFALMAATAAAAIALYPSPWSLPLWLAYGTLYGSAMDSRWHECGHATAFKTPWMNRALHHIACFCMMRDPVCWRHSHSRHHAETLIPGRDPEIAVMRPTRVLKLAANLVGIPDAATAVKAMFIHAAGRLTAEETAYVPASRRASVVRTARIWLAVYATTLFAAIALQSWIPLLLIGLPRLYGCWHMVICGWLQHGGLDDHVSDYRLNSRTVLMNPISRFIYWNMNYHLEHHLFPLVPYHRLPDLHRAIAHDLPPPSPSILSAMTELLPALARQFKDPDFTIRRPLPATATPYQL